MKSNGFSKKLKQKKRASSKISEVNQKQKKKATSL